VTRLEEGIVPCLIAEGTDIPLNSLCYIREIPNMLGHCVVLHPTAEPLIGYHTDRFEGTCTLGLQPMVEGVARCIEDYAGIDKDEIVFIREIPNMRAHCIVLRQRKMPVLGLRLSQFRLLEEHEDWVMPLRAPEE
jgi:hypothetical protein